jgi:gamma-glutamyltranspeptidase / glutathione hydrolase
VPLDPRGGLLPPETRYGRHGAVCANDHLAATAGMAMFHAGGNAADAAVAAGAVMAVVSPHSNGLGGDLFAVVHAPGGAPVALNASGRAGTGAAAVADALRAEGHTVVPDSGDIRTATVPGCADGWVALHTRFGRLPLADVLAPAIDCAAEGFPASRELAALAPFIAGTAAGPDFTGCEAGSVVRTPGAAHLLRTLADEGRDAYHAVLAADLVAAADGLFAIDDVLADHADWIPALGVRAFGHDLWSVPPNSQGYVALSAAWIADGLDIPEDDDDPRWAHLLIEAMRQAAHDRLDALHEHADGEALVAPERLGPRRDAIDEASAAPLAPAPPMAGATTYLCAVDRDLAVSLIQSLASVWGSGVALPEHRVFMQSRALGFSLDPAHPAAYTPGRRPPHTLTPAMVTRLDGSLAAVLGLRGADAQPQVVLQLAARLLRSGQSPSHALRAPRWAVVSEADAGFDTWRAPNEARVKLEFHAPDTWRIGLASRGHHVVEARGGVFDAIGNAHVIWRESDVLGAACEPRASNAAALAY